MPGIYVGFNIGTNSVGYAVTDKQYNLKRKFGEDAWGSVHFQTNKIVCSELIFY